MANRDPHSPRQRTRTRRDSAPSQRSMLRYTLLAALIWTVLAGGLMVAHWVSELPDIAGLLVQTPSREVTLLDDKGRVIGRRGLKQGDFVTVSELSPFVADAFIAIEDRRFRSHFGIDPIGMARALVVNTMAGKFVQGGSTITQQLAKNLFLRPDRTIKRKIEEALLALWLESRYTKDEILTLYLNRVYFGAGVYGIEAASERFFGKHAEDLTLTEAAILAGSLKAPSRYNPANDPDAAAARAQLVLQAMLDAGFIDKATWREASTTRAKITHDAATPNAGYFIDYVLSQLPGFAGQTEGRLIVETTLDLDTQRAAERALDQGLAKDGSTLSAGQGALVALATNGAVRALVGGRSYDASPFDRVTDALRQPGSAFKPFVFLTALEHGHTPNDVMNDGPVTIGKWHPDNYEGEYEGDITLAHALAHSSNSIAVQLTREVGPAAVARTARRLGITAELHAVPALALGTSEVTPLELTGAYAAFADGGQAVLPYVIVRVRTASGKVLYARQGPGAGRVMSAANAATMTRMMEGTVNGGTGKAARLDHRPAAGKTGTSQDYRDAWFIGFTADYVCGVWIGNDDNAPMKRVTGGGLPARIFKSFMAEAEKDLPPQPLVDGTTMVAAADLPEAAVDPNSPDATAEHAPAAGDRQTLIDAFEAVVNSLF